MKIAKQFFMLALAAPAFLIARAQTADEIINKHFDAIGGKDKISQIKSIYSESSVQVMGNDAPSTLTILNGKGYRLESDFNGQKMIQVYTDKGGWAVNPMAGGTDPQAMPDDQYKQGKDQIDVGGPLLDYSSKGNKVEMLGKDEAGYKVKVTNKDGIATTYWIDPNTYYITKASFTGSMMGQEMEVTRNYSNYQKTDYGYTMPFTIEINYGGQFSVTSNVKKVQVNKDVDPKIFDMTAK